MPTVRTILPQNILQAPVLRVAAYCRVSTDPFKNYIAHKGALQKTVSVYYLTDGHWMPFDHTNHADVELRE